MKLRCSSIKEAEDWKEALEAESAVPMDCSPAQEESSATEVLTLLHEIFMTLQIHELGVAIFCDIGGVVV